MAARTCSATLYAIELHIAQRKTVTESCRLAGIARSTLYKALKKKEKNKSRK